MTNPPPKHYPDGTFQPWNVIEAWGLNFNLGNVAKYIARAGKKGPALDDLVKASNYLNREIDYLAHAQLATCRHEEPGIKCGCGNPFSGGLPCK